MTLAGYAEAGLSPRTRGSPITGCHTSSLSGPIPADAGEPPPRWSTSHAIGGLSPRTRGSHGVECLAGGQQGPIPADAGEPSSTGPLRQQTRAYPRGRGGAVPTRQIDRLLPGLSPRTRGSLQSEFPGCAESGPIPADAGEPSASPRWIESRRAYPRGRGGAEVGDALETATAGLSPRTRGSRAGIGQHILANGPIPADAGEPARPERATVPAGAYPRGRGGALDGQPAKLQLLGLSPRTRGSRRGSRGRSRRYGPIPADAGEPWPRTVASAGIRAYPRGRGGATRETDAQGRVQGLSPRTRGSPTQREGAGFGTGPIPADAGEPPTRTCPTRPPWAYPRGRGGAATTAEAPARLAGLSPRTRGSLEVCRPRSHHPGPIPADAGEPRGGCRAPELRGAYPRGRGGAVTGTLYEGYAEGLSPRTRGSRHGAACAVPVGGPIPADAGEPLEVKPMTPKEKLKKPCSQFVKEIELAAAAWLPTSHPSRPVLSAALRHERGRYRQFRCCRARP